MKTPVIQNLTTHIEVDIPDGAVGFVQRYLAGIRGVQNLSVQPNGTAKKKGESPSKMNDSTKKEVIVAFLQTTDRATLVQISSAVEEAGFVSAGLGSYLTDLVNDKLIQRVDRGVYSAAKALPAPKKKGAASGK